jgi:hypothetical protein
LSHPSGAVARDHPAPAQLVIALYKLVQAVRPASDIVAKAPVEIAHRTNINGTGAIVELVGCDINDVRRIVL